MDKHFWQPLTRNPPSKPLKSCACFWLKQEARCAWSPAGLPWQTQTPKLLSRTRLFASLSKKVNISEVRGQLMWSNPCRSSPASIYYPGQKSLQPRHSWDWSAVWSCDISQNRPWSATRARDTQLPRVVSMSNRSSISHDFTWSDCRINLMNFSAVTIFFGQGSTSLTDTSILIDTLVYETSINLLSAKLSFQLWYPGGQHLKVIFFFLIWGKITFKVLF